MKDVRQAVLLGLVDSVQRKELGKQTSRLPSLIEQTPPGPADTKEEVGVKEPLNTRAVIVAQAVETDFCPSGPGLIPGNFVVQECLYSYWAFNLAHQNQW